MSGDVAWTVPQPSVKDERLSRLGSCLHHRDWRVGRTLFNKFYVLPVSLMTVFV